MSIRIRVGIDAPSEFFAKRVEELMILMEDREEYLKEKHKWRPLEYMKRKITSDGPLLLMDSSLELNRRLACLY